MLDEASMARRAAHKKDGWTQWTESEARRALAEHAASGMSAAEFCRARGYSTQRLRYWSARLPQAPSASFVLVALPAASSGRIEIASGEVVLRVREDLDVEHVARLAVALAAERARRC